MASPVRPLGEQPHDTGCSGTGLHPLFTVLHASSPLQVRLQASVFALEPSSDLCGLTGRISGNAQVKGRVGGGNILDLFNFHSSMLVTLHHFTCDHFTCEHFTCDFMSISFEIMLTFLLIICLSFSSYEREFGGIELYEEMHFGVMFANMSDAS